MKFYKNPWFIGILCIVACLLIAFIISIEFMKMYDNQYFESKRSRDIITKYHDDQPKINYERFIVIKYRPQYESIEHIFYGDINNGIKKQKGLCEIEIIGYYKRTSKKATMLERVDCETVKNAVLNREEYDRWPFSNKNVMYIITSWKNYR